VVSGGCFVGFWWLKGGWEGGAAVAVPCRERRRRGKREKVS